jgi:hypothetical protein
MRCRQDDLTADALAGVGGNPGARSVFVTGGHAGAVGAGVPRTNPVISVTWRWSRACIPLSPHDATPHARRGTRAPPLRLRCHDPGVCRTAIAQRRDTTGGPDPRSAANRARDAVPRDDAHVGLQDRIRRGPHEQGQRLEHAADHVALPTLSLFVTEGALAAPTDELMAMIAHELGHLMLRHVPQSGRRGPVSEDAWRVIQAQELEADRFAVALLKQMTTSSALASCEALGRFLRRGVPDWYGEDISARMEDAVTERVVSAETACASAEVALPRRVIPVSLAPRSDSAVAVEPDLPR